MGKRGPKTASVMAAKPQARSRRKTLPWNKRGLSRAERVIAFCEFLPITSGVHAGRKLILRPWQREIVRALYAVDVDGRRQVRTGVITVPRKNGKTALAAALALCHLLGPEAESRGQVFSAAADREQAAIIYREMEAIILRVPEFSERCHIQAFHRTITDLKTGSSYQALSSDARKAHGLSPSFMVYDELAQSHDRELYDNLTTGTGARAEPLMIVISTQSPSPAHIMSELVDYALKIEDGTLPPDPSFYGCAFAAPDDADPWDEQVWHDCNPALGDFRSLEEMKNFAEQARKIPAKESIFRALYLNQRVDAAAKWIASADFDACVSKIPDLTGRTCYGGLDLASTQDLCALSLCFPPVMDGEPFWTLHYAWCPKDAIKRRSKADHVPYELWEKQKYIEATPGTVIDYDYILARLDEVAKKYSLEAVLFDRWGAARIVAELEAMGLEVIEFGQGFASMSPPAKELEKLILERKIKFSENPVLRWCFGNVITEVDAAGNVKPSKKRSREKIDLVVSTIMALDGALRNAGKEVHPEVRWM
ncbi:MAG: terminase [delta proteobacterium MLS_D]|nr:MAG: terminase [delta proteobacterium MLS_D]